MANVLETQEPLGRGGIRPPGPSGRITVLIMLAYTLCALLLTWRIWADPEHMVPQGGDDINLNIWFMRYAETALAHGHLPALVTTAVNAPEGINVMWNTSLLLPGVLLAPVTWLAGPVLSLAVLLTLGFAASAGSMFWALRRWDAPIGAAAAGGAFYAFMPALVIAAEDHYHLQFAVLPPLILDAAARLATGRGRPLRAGLWLGLLVAAQLFIAEELLLDTVIAAAVILLILALVQPHAAIARARDALAGTVAALCVAAVLCSFALWRQFGGPLAEHGSPWHPAKYGNHLASVVTAPVAGLVNSPGTFNRYLTATGQFPLEVYAYLGWPLIVALIGITITCWADIKIRVLALSFFAVEWLSMGGHRQRVLGLPVPAGLFPWHYLQHLPLSGDLIVTRLSILADALAAAVLTFAIARVTSAIRRLHGSRRLAAAVTAAAAVAAIAVPLIPLPLIARPVVPRPPGWQAVLARLSLPAGAPVLVLPFAGGTAMEWQATAGTPISVIGGWCVTPDPSGRAATCETKAVQTPAQRTAYLRTNWLASGPGKPGPSSQTMETALSQWQARAILITPGASPALARYVTALLGRPDARQGGLLGWRLSPADRGQPSRRAGNP
jgi:hypothetical protein